MSRTLLILLTLLALPAVAGCSGNSTDDQRLRQEQLDDAREAGRQEAETAAKQRAQEEKTKELERELRALKRGDGQRSTATPVPTSGGSPAPASTSSGNCGGGIDVNSSTSCPFARNVESEYYGAGGDSPIEVYSPATGSSYTMTCGGTGPVVCTGGNGARVEFG